jgi:hypothetical protein
MIMTISPGLTAEQITALVLEYELQPWGTKAAWAKEQGISQARLRRMRQAVFFGDVRRGLVPRKGAVLAQSRDRREFIESISDPYAEIERLRQENLRLEKTADALGKAIGLLQQMREHEPDQTSASETKSTMPKQN